MKVLLWSKWNKKPDDPQAEKKTYELGLGVFVFNHLGEFTEAAEPEPKSDVQKRAWPGQKWERREAILENGKVTYEGERLKYASTEQE